MSRNGTAEGVRWIAQQQGSSYYLTTVHAPPRAFAAKMNDNKSKITVKATSAPAPVKERAPKPTAPTAATADGPVFDSSWSATAVFTLSGEPLGNAFLRGNTAHVVPVVPLLPSAPSPATSSTPETAQMQKHRDLFNGKPRKAWGCLVSLPDPEPEQHKQKTIKGKGIARRGRRSSKRVWYFVGSLEPLLLARRKKQQRRRRSASLDADVDNPDENSEEDDDADADGDTDDGIWPDELVVPTIVVTEPEAEPEMEMVGTSITPEDVERAIGAAFAIGTAA